MATKKKKKKKRIPDYIKIRVGFIMSMTFNISLYRYLRIIENLSELEIRSLFYSNSVNEIVNANKFIEYKLLEQMKKNDKEEYMPRM